MRESVLIVLGGLKRVSRFFVTGKIGDLCQKLEKKLPNTRIVLRR